MTRSKHLGANNNKLIIKSFNIKGFKVLNYIYANNFIIYYITKDYSANFNINFNGKVELEVVIPFNFFETLIPIYYPLFKEVSNIIPKNADNHINYNGTICYAPPYRPIHEKWKFIDFVNAVDSMINNYFTIEYIGTSSLIELEHGINGCVQYSFLLK